MSVSLLLEDDHVISLEEALAFLETCAPEIDESATSDTSTDSEPTHAIWSSSPSASSSASSSPLPLLEFEYDHVARRKGQPLTPKNGTSKPQRRSRNPKVYQQQSHTTTVRQPSMTKSREANTKAVNRYRQRNRAEVQSLREQVEQLSLHITKLQERVAPVSSAQIALLNADSRALDTSSNLQLAVAEYQKLQESEALNRKLKDALAKQKRMSKTLEKVFRKQISTNVRTQQLVSYNAFCTLFYHLNVASLLTFAFELTQNLDFVGEIRPLEEKFYAQDDSIVFREMLYYLRDVVYSTTATITAAIRKYDTTCMFSNSRMLQDPILGQIFEFTSNAPIPCTLQQLDARFWAMLSGFVGNQLMGQTTNQSRDTLENSCGKQFSSKFDTSVGEMQVDGVCAIRKFWTHDQIVFVFTSLLAPVGTGLLFREQVWMILSESSAITTPGSPSSSVFQTCYRLFLEKRDTSSAITPQTTYIYNAIMTNQSDKMRTQHLEMQETLLCSQDPDPLVRMPSMCLQLECGVSTSVSQVV